MYHRIAIAEVVDETPDARSFVLDIPASLAPRFAYRAGQFLTFRIESGGADIARCYSLSSAPGVDPRPKVTVKRVAGGRGSNWFNDKVRAGTFVDVAAPSGFFLLREGEAPLLMVAGGSGITPIVSLIKSALATTAREVRLFYANRDAGSVIFRSELDRLQAAHPGRLDVRHHLDAASGFATPKDIAAARAGFEDAETYLCGPGPFMAMAEQALIEAGCARERVHIERFETAAGPKAEAPPAAASAGETPKEIVIHINGARHVVPYAPGKSILEIAKDAGLSPPSACEEGHCGSCAARRLKGDVTMAVNEAFGADELERGWILTCQARPTGPECEITYDP